VSKNETREKRKFTIYPWNGNYYTYITVTQSKD
jgi:hypothetical protein